MNVIDFLTEDHDRLRRRMSLIRDSIDHPDLRERVREFVSCYEMHEAIEEDIVFPAFDAALASLGGQNAATGHPGSGGGARPAGDLPDHEVMHVSLWNALEKLVSCLNTPHQCGFRQAFFDFSAQAEGHFRSEEQFLFPAVRAALDDKELGVLGGKARAKMDRFAEGEAHEHT